MAVRRMSGAGRRMLASAWSAALALLLALVGGAAQAVPHQLAFKAVESLGPDSQAILSLLQDRQGFIWIGTVEGGLFRYDGSKAVKYVNDSADPHSLPGGRVAALYNDTQGQLWVGTDEGLARYDPASNGFIRYLPDAGPANVRIVRRIIGDSNHGMWLATWGGLQHFDPASGHFRVYQNDPHQPGSLAHNDINGIAMDDKGGVWAGTWPGGLDYLAPGASQFQHFRVDSEAHPNPKLNDVRALQIDSTGQLWMGTAGGLVQWNMHQPWEQRQRRGDYDGRITDIEEDRAGDLWVSTRTGGLLRWDQGMQQFQAYVHRSEDRYSLSNDAINTSMHDRTGTLWVGMLTDGVSRANLGYHGFERFIPRDIAPAQVKSSNFVRSVGAAPDGRLWLGLDDGLGLFDPATRQMLQVYPSRPDQPGALSSNVIYSLYQDGAGTLWAGTSNGLNRLERGGKTFQVVHFGSHTRDFINAVRPGKGGILWLAAGDALLRYDPHTGAVRSYGHDAANPDSRSVDGASSVLEDHAGRVWTGEFFRGGGLDMLDPASGKFRHFRHDPARMDSLSSDRVICMHEDAEGTLWVGTTHGLNRIAAAHDGHLVVRRYQDKGALGNVPIEAVQSDRSGMIWATSVAGLLRLDPYSDSVTEYSVEDGLTEGFNNDASATASDGKLYFGSSNGFTGVNPAIHSSASRPPQLAITDISIFNRSLRADALPPGVTLQGSVTEPRALTLPWRSTMLSIEFAALHFAEPRMNSYSYWLEGFDPEWVQADARHPVATYTNLPPGSYRFHLQGSNNKGVASKDELVLPITVTPPWWQTWWARGLAGLLALTLTMLVYRWRVRSLTGRARELEALVAERTRALKESNQKLATLSATDGLTGIANRRSFDDALDREWRRAARDGKALALAMLDVDHFKLYNDQYGHQAGDECLRRVAQVLLASVQRAGDVVARYGGEEFAFIAPATEGEDALEMARRVCHALEALAMPHERSSYGHVTASIGVAVCVPARDGAPDSLLRAADQALYRAKSDGRNCCVLTTVSMAPPRLEAVK